jgi:outer membrane protein OmpA-like peptidoglycan-associated protein
MKHLFFLTAALVIAWSNTFAATADTSTSVQPKTEVVSVKKADNLFAGQQFRAALNGYAKAYGTNSSNPDLNFKMGLCYHYMGEHPELCETYFTAAGKKYSFKYNFYNSKNTNTSFDANYFLGKTYLAQNKIDTAMYYLADWSSELKNEVPMDAARQLKMCVNNNLLKRLPRMVKAERLLAPINTLHSETHPVLSIDHQTIFYSSNRPEGETGNDLIADDDIYYSVMRKDGQWGDPVSFSGNTPADEEPLYLSTDGKKLYFRRKTKNGTGDIYFATQENGTWGAAQKLKEANSTSDEKGISFSADGTQMVVSSNRPDGNGGYDLYIAKSNNGKFGKLTNLGKTVNSELDEVSPYFHPVDKRIYFSTNGNTKYGMGGFDIFFIQSDSGTAWSEPFTMGYPLNKGGNEQNYYVVSEGVACYTALSENGDFDIFEIKRGAMDENIEKEILAGSTVRESADNSVVEVIEVEKEKIVEKDREVEVSKLEEVKVEVQTNVGEVTAEQAKNLDNVIAIEQREVQVQVPVEVEVVTASGTRPLMMVDGTVTNADGTVHEELTAQNKGTAPTNEPATNTATAPTPTAEEQANTSSYNVTPTSNADNTSSYNTSSYNAEVPTETVIEETGASSSNSYNNTAPVAENKTTEPKAEEPAPKLLKEPAPYTKSYSHVVTEGETLESIAQKYEVSTYDLKQWNKLKSNSVRPQSMLVVGYDYNENLKYELAMKQLEMAGISSTDKKAIVENVKKILEEKLSRERSAVYKSIPFTFNSQSLGISNNELDVLTAYMKDHKDVTIEVVGHTDNIGAWETNFWVSRQRAKSVYDYLVAKGVSTSRIIFNGKGAIQPVADNTTQEGRAKNRRVEVVLIQ